MSQNSVSHNSARQTQNSVAITDDALATTNISEQSATCPSEDEDTTDSENEGTTEREDDQREYDQRECDESDYYQGDYDDDSESGWPSDGFSQCAEVSLLPHFPFFDLPPEVRSMIFSYALKDAEDEDALYDTVFKSLSCEAILGITQGIASNATLVSHQFRKEYLDEIARSTSLIFAGRADDFLPIASAIGPPRANIVHLWPRDWRNLNPAYANIRHVVISQNVSSLNKLGSSGLTLSVELGQFISALKGVFRNIQEIDMYFNMSEETFERMAKKGLAKLGHAFEAFPSKFPGSKVKLNVHFLLRCQQYKLLDPSSDAKPDLPENKTNLYAMLPGKTPETSWYGMEFELVDERVEEIGWLMHTW